MKNIALVVFFLAGFNGLYAQAPILSTSHSQRETPLAMNPTDPNNLVAAAITGTASPLRIGAYYSTNAGQSWSGSDDVVGSGDLTDPVVAFDPDGNAYLLYQSSNVDLLLKKSSDGGASWGTAANVLHVDSPAGIDKPWFATSPSRNSSGYFDMYISVSYSPNSTSQTIKLLRCTDGSNTFTDVTLDSDLFSAGLQQAGSCVVVGPSNEVLLAWAEVNNSGAVTKIGAARSTNQGSGFGAVTHPTVTQIGSKTGNNYYLKSGNVRVDCFPRVAVDAGSGWRQGYAYLVWATKTAATNTSDIMMLRGTITSGLFAWDSQPTAVAQQTDDQWSPAASVSSDGVLSVSYYSSGPNLIDPIYPRLLYSTDGSTFSSEQALDQNGFSIPDGGPFIGDYNGLVSPFGKASALWCNYSSTNGRQAYFRSISTAQLTGFQSVVLNQLDESAQSFGKIGYWNLGHSSNTKREARCR